MNASLRSTTNVPIVEHSAPTISAATNARCMKSYWNGSSRCTAALVPVRVGVLANRGVRARLEHVLGRAVGEDAPVDHDQAVEPVRRAVEVVGRHQHRQPVGHEAAHEPQQRLLGRRVDPGGGLVEQQQERLLSDRAGDEDALLLPARELADVPAGQLAEVERLDRAVDRAPVVGRERPERPQARVAPHRDHVAHADREAPVDVLDLRHVADRPGRQPVGRLALDAHGAAGRLDQPGDRLEQRGLARPVGPDDAHRRSAGQVERDPGERGDALVADVQVVDFDGVHFSADTIVSVSVSIRPT